MSVEKLGQVVGSLASKPQVIPPLPASTPSLTLTIEKFTALTEVVIDNFEGGYYHPSMKKNFNARSQKALGDSGETMFGLDRKHGAQLAKFPEWGQFWTLVDADKAKNPGSWKYQYRGGLLASKLKTLTSAIMFKWFSYLAGKYILISSMDEIANDDRLIIHFSYGSWNGEGWFKRFARALNKAIQKYEGDKEKIFSTAIKARTEAWNEDKKGNPTTPNTVIRQQGANMMALFKRMKLV